MKSNPCSNTSKIFYGWIVVIGCILITMTMVPPIMTLNNKYLMYATQELGISRSSFAWANTLLQAVGIFLSPFAARKLARGNMKKFQSLSIIGYCVCYFAYSFAQSEIHLYLISILVGIFYLHATLIPVSMMITNWFVKKRGLAMSLAMTSIGIGSLIFSPIFTWLLENYGWRHTYQIMSVVILVITLPTALFILKKQPEDMGLTALGAGDVSVVHGAKNTAHVKLSVTESNGKLFFWMFLIGMLANGIINSGALGQLAPAIRGMYGISVQTTIISMYSLIGIGGALVLGWINDKYGAVVSAVFGCFMFGLSFVLLLLAARSVAMLYAMAIVFGLGNAIDTVSPPLITAAVFGKEKYGAVYGVVNSFSQTGLLLGSMGIATIYDLSGSYNTVWVILLILTIITLVSWCGAILMSRKYR